MKDKIYIRDMNYVYFGGANYTFRFCEVIEDLYLLEPNGYRAIRGMSDDWIDDVLEKIFQDMCIDSNDYDFEGPISEWKHKLYIILLNKKNISALKEFFTKHNSYYFYAEWISYFKEDEVLVDIGHAFDGSQERLQLNNKLSRNKVKEFEQRRGFDVDWSDDF